MPAERFFIPEVFHQGTSLDIEGTEQHHLVNVMRTRIGDAVELVNGQGQLAIAKLIQTEKKKAILEIQSVTTSEPPKQRIIIAQAIPRFAKLELIMEKCTELGMTELWLFPGARSEKKELSDNQQERLHTIGVAAMKQCGRLFLPTVTFAPQLSKWKKLPVKHAYYGDVRENAPWIGSEKVPDALCFIGPESGFTDDEIGILQLLHAQGVKLSGNTLRTETAAIAATCLLYRT